MSELAAPIGATEESDAIFASIEEIIADLQAGKMVILTDDEDRENEGDFIVAAEFVTPEIITLMTRQASGIITNPMTVERLQALHLDLMVAENSEALRTAFTVTVDAREGTSTGSSAGDRAHTMRVLADPNAQPSDFNRPGHVNPLMARKGGVLKRAGHTEAAVDLMELAGLQPVGVICEIMGDDGEMARLPELIPLAKKFDVKIGTIADLIKYRRRTEKLIAKVAVAKMPTQYGDFVAHAYTSAVDDNEYVAFVMGDVTTGEPILCRIHLSSPTGDLLDALRLDSEDRLHLALQKIRTAGKGVLLYIQQRGRAYSLPEGKTPEVQTELPPARHADPRNFGIGAQILADLGITSLRYMTNNPTRLAGLAGFGIEITEVVSLR